ncbi:MAG: universal stress protein [Dehalococcoidales bacterium]|jgi:nucleotide-binding universal stress UspA family protein|nr:universal stress protein [Dehalococcoidales bacterium]
MFKKILVPLDGSELSESALTYLTEITTDCRALDVILIRIHEPPDPNVIGTLDATIAVELDEAYRDEASRYLDTVVAALKEKGINARTEIMAGNPAEEILKYSQSNNVDLIIMSTRGRSGISRWVFGSVAEKVIRNSTVPVLIKPPVTGK